MVNHSLSLPPTIKYQEESTDGVHRNRHPGGHEEAQGSTGEQSQRPRTAETIQFGGPGTHENRVNMEEKLQDPARNQPGAAKRARRTPREGPLRPNAMKTMCFS